MVMENWWGSKLTKHQYLCMWDWIKSNVAEIFEEN